MARPLCIDLFSGLGGWTKGFLAEGWDCIGFDIERHRYPRTILRNHIDSSKVPTQHDTFKKTGKPCGKFTDPRYASGEIRQQVVLDEWDEYPGQLVLQNVLTLHGSQFKDAACIVASPPCQEYSYMAMPWQRAKQIAATFRGEAGFPPGYTGSRTIPQLTTLFDACFRIQREASEAAGHHIPMVIENVKGAQPWVGRANANYGSFFLWGDVRSVGGRIVAAHQVQFGAPAVKAYRSGAKVPGMSWSGSDKPGYKPLAFNGEAERRLREGQKVPMNFHEYEKTGKPGRSFQSAAVDRLELGVKSTDGWSGFNGGGSGGSGDDLQGLSKVDGSWSVRGAGKYESRTSARKAASAQIAEIPFELSSWVARCFKPDVAITQRVC